MIYNNVPSVHWAPYHCIGLSPIANALSGISIVFKCLVQHLILRCEDVLIVHVNFIYSFLPEQEIL